MRFTNLSLAAVAASFALWGQPAGAAAPDWENPGVFAEVEGVLADVTEETFAREGAVGEFVKEREAEYGLIDGSGGLPGVETPLLAVHDSEFNFRDF